MSTSYGNYVGDIGSPVNEANYSKFILEKGTEDIDTYRRKMIVGADFVEVDLNIDSQNSTVAKAIYNAVPSHSLPLSINMLNNALLKVRSKKYLLK